MFGLNDDKAAVDPGAQNNQDDQADYHAEGADNHHKDSPFAAAYSSLNGDNGSQPSNTQNDTPQQSDPVSTVPEEDLLQIKTQALQNLAPLVNHLDQSAQERFKTTMMMIQASDNAELIRDAYEAANSIEDEKIRAQALLDVINEINYFTQRGKS